MRRQLNRWEAAAGLHTDLDDRARQTLAYAERRLGRAGDRLEKEWARAGVRAVLDRVGLFPITNPRWEEALVTLGDDPACIRELAAYERAIKAETELVKQLVGTQRAEQAANVLTLDVLVHRFEPDELGGALGDEPIYVPMPWSGLAARRFRLRRHRWRYTRMRVYLRELQSELDGAREWIEGRVGEKLPSDWGRLQENPNRAGIVRDLRAKGVVPITEGLVFFRDSVPQVQAGREEGHAEAAREFRQFMQLHGLSAGAALRFVCRPNVPSSMPVPSLPVFVAESPRAPRDRAVDYWEPLGSWARPAWRSRLPCGGWHELPIGTPLKVQSDLWPYHASKGATAQWLSALPSVRPERREPGQFSDPNLAFVTTPREDQERRSQEWSVGALEHGARPTFPPANVHPGVAVGPPAINVSPDVDPCLRLRALPFGAVWNSVRGAEDAFDPDMAADEDAYWFACGDEDSNWGSRATARRGKVLGYRHREEREAERRVARQAKGQEEDRSCHPLDPRPIDRGPRQEAAGAASTRPCRSRVPHAVGRPRIRNQDASGQDSPTRRDRRGRSRAGQKLSPT